MMRFVRFLELYNSGVPFWQIEEILDAEDFYNAA